MPLNHPTLQPRDIGPPISPALVPMLLSLDMFSIESLGIALFFFFWNKTTLLKAMRVNEVADAGSSDDSTYSVSDSD